MASAALTDAGVGAPVSLSRRQTNVIFAAITLGLLLAALDATIVSTALPTIVADLGSAGHMSWVVTAYLLAETVATVLTGKFGDMFGRKTIFQLSAVIFVGGSIVCGVAQDMIMLIVARAVQGIGAGGLMVTAMALIADVIPLRERGRYQGALGAVFGITTVVGPTLGGLFTDHLTWRWVFYINVPLAIVMLAVTAVAVPKARATVHPIIDYVGIALVSVGASGMILALSWAGNEYPWSSPVIIGLFAVSIVLLAAFVLVERRATEPMLPMRLFRNSVFTVCSILSFIVGFALLGVMTFLPTYLQFVDGVSATASGLRLLPLVVGLFITSLLSGALISRTGRYRVFPIVGCAIMAVGLWLMSTMGPQTGFWVESAYMFTLGLGIGLSMQVLTIAVQNTVRYADLGTATSGVTFFRTLGSAFGTAVFGSLFTNQLTPALKSAMAQLPGVPPVAAQNPEALQRLPAELRAPIEAAYADSIGYVFRWVVPVALLGFVVALFLKEVPLRDAAREAATDVGDAFSAPMSDDRVDQLERAIGETVRRELGDRAFLARMLADAGGNVTPAQAWGLAQIHLFITVRGHADLADIAHRFRLPPEVLQPVFDDLRQAGLVRLDGTEITLTPAGHARLDQLRAAWRHWLDEHLDDWTPSDPTDSALLDRALNKIANRLVNEEAHRVAVAS